LAGDGFFNWVEWGRLFQMGWMRTAFSTGFFGWVDLERFFQMSEIKTSSSNELNENVYFEWE
jgi:hypothetical protein